MGDGDWHGEGLYHDLYDIFKFGIAFELNLVRLELRY